ncbi:family 2 encapsulin nanocompartment cargo protein terpene cyclase [Amycolatopsis rubida]|uniref:Terpene synthase n=1 Tax=Amycolatopsis rubida TaxID=112413 RepID=A0A1I5RPT2_9PSEU|nr:family 2 encapsulin nanocompartment cargo protein terpene cyclase [Amycolatopsis rubida]SFP60410.1 2-methylisoborneol synthase [Amycolatopsis rubida]
MSGIAATRPGLACPSPLWAGPLGLGTSAARIAAQFAPPHGTDPAYAEREWDEGSASPLYCPVVRRVDDPLAEEVDRRLVAWARDCGFESAGLDQIAHAGFGRLVMLAHPDTSDPDRLLVAAQLNAVWWAADDYYADDSSLGASPTELPPRLALVMAAMDPVAPAGEFSAPREEALRADPIRVGFRSAVGHLGRHGSPVLVQRVCYSTFAMFVSWDAYAAWRHTGRCPPAWEYLAARQHDSFSASMTLIDPVGGYELPAPFYYEPRVREAMMRAGTATVLVNDLHSVAKEAADENPVCNMALQIAADRNCPVSEAVEATVALHNRIVREFEEGHRALLAIPSPELRRFLAGLRDWMGGGFEWHATNPRYRS